MKHERQPPANPAGTGLTGKRKVIILLGVALGIAILFINKWLTA